MHLDLICPCTDDVVDVGAQIVWHAFLVLHVIAAAERLPCEVVLVDREVAGEPLDALAQHRYRIAGRHQLVVLSRRNAQRI